MNILLVICFCLIQGVLFGQPPTILKVIDQDIRVNGKTAKVFDIVREDGSPGLSKVEGEAFNVLLDNRTSVPTSIHWHGIILPNRYDGIPYVTQFPVQPGEQYPYNFKIVQNGSYWMHSHYRFQEQKLLSAPLIIYRNKEEQAAHNDQVMFLEDFTFQDPKAIFESLRNSAKERQRTSMPKKMDLNDVNYDAFLTNRRTLDNPAIRIVKPGEMLRLRVINGASSSNFFIKLGQLIGSAVAVDGQDIYPLPGNAFEVAMSQRIDIMVKIPETGGAFPVLAQGEGTDMLTGIILATADAAIPKIEEKADQKAGGLSYEQEKKLKAAHPLKSRPIDRRLTVNLEGKMADYVWMLNGQIWPYATPLMVKNGERVEIAFVNKTGMSHPMHLHGHFFQITEIDGEPLAGAMRDTILVMPGSTLKVQFDADNPGVWMLHCHNMYHQHAGMMTTVNYEGYIGPSFTKEQQLEAN